MGSATTVIVLTLLAINALDNPYRPGLGQIKPVAMERSLRILDSARAVAERQGAAAVRRPRRSGPVLMEDATEPLRPPLRARGDRAARDGGGGDRLGGVPVGALARRAGARPRAPRSPRASSRRARRTWRIGRRRSTSRCSRSGSTPTRATRPSSPPSIAGASAPSSSRRSRPGSRPGRGRTPTRRCRRSPCRSTSSRPPRRPTASRRRPPRSPRASGRYIQRADNYSLAVVLFAASLFFAGISTRLQLAHAADGRARARLHAVPRQR